MDTIWQTRAIHEIIATDKNGLLISSIGDGTIQYNTKNLKVGRAINLLTDEEIVRGLLVCRLHFRAGYPVDSIELETEYSAGRPKPIKPRIDVIVRDNRNPDSHAAFLFIEVKSPDKFDSDRSLIEGQLFDLALLEEKNGPVGYLVYHSIEPESLSEKDTIIDFTKYHDFRAWTEAGSISLDTLPANYGQPRKRRFVNLPKDQAVPSDHQVLNVNVSRDTFFALRRDLHNVLWGGGSMSYNDIFSNLVRLFLAKIYDEETTPVGDPFRFQIEFNGDEPESTELLFDRIDQLFRECKREYLGYTNEEISKSVGIDREKMSPSKVAYVVERIQGISLRENRNRQQGDLLGEFFEGIVSDGFKQDKGQFFTHHNIVHFILEALDVRRLAHELVLGRENPAKPRLPYICDPSCGSGTFLISVMKDVSDELAKIEQSENLAYKTREFLASAHPTFTPNVWAATFIYGVEPHPDLAMATKVNMVLHGDGNINIFRTSGLLKFTNYSLPSKVSALAQIAQRDLPPLASILPRFESYPTNEQFDVVVSNPPFSMDLDQETERALPDNFLFAEKRNSETLFVERWFQLLRPGGRLGAILPDSIFDNKEDVDIRVFIYRFFNIKAIVSLPMLAFQPYTPTKTSILFATKKAPAEVSLFDETWNAEHQSVAKHLRHIAFSIKRKEFDSDFRDAAAYVLSGLAKPDELLKMKPQDLFTSFEASLKDCLEYPYWVVFRRVVASIASTPFVVAHAEQIGYKRSKKTGESPRPNELYQDSLAQHTKPIHPDFPSILDYIKSVVRW